jgi:hypothetical protein
MADIKDCIGKRVKISKASLTIKNNEGKTCGVVRNIVSLYNMQPNRQMDYYSKLKRLNISMKDISLRDVIIKDNIMYVFRNVKTKLFYANSDYEIDDCEKEKMEKQEVMYDRIKNAGIEVIECIFV